MFNGFSPNMLKTFDSCPKKFEFKYVKNISMPVNDEIFETGKNIHALASYCLKGENIDNMEPELTPNEAKLWNHLKNTEYFSFQTINTEYNLSVKIGNYFFGGRLDALVKNNDTYYILDYKTGSAPKNAKFDYQTMIYLLSVQAFFNTDNINFIYLDLKNETEVKIEFTPELGEKYRKILSDTAEKINKFQFKQDSKNCPCEYNIICYH